MIGGRNSRAASARPLPPLALAAALSVITSATAAPGSPGTSRTESLAAPRGIGAPHAPRPDPQIKKEIERRLAKDQSVNARLIEVSVTHRVVLLRGTVKSLASKTRAEELAWVRGVSRVKNRLRVDGL